MGFWEYPDSSSGDDNTDAPETAACGKSIHSPCKFSQLAQKALGDLADSSAVQPTQKQSKKHVLEIEDDDDDEPVARRRPKKRKSVIKGINIDQDTLPAHLTEEALRLKQIQAQARQAFEDDDDVDDDDADEQAAAATPAQIERAPVRSVEQISDDEEEIEAEIEREQAEILKQGSGASAGDAFVLKVVCERGHAQVRQEVGENFIELMDKFRAHAIKQGWATKESRMTLVCDDEDVNLENSKPDDFDLEEGDTLDVRIS